MKDTNEYNKEYHYFQNLISKGKFDKCLFVDGCTEPPIDAHSVSRSILSAFQQENQVIQPSSRNFKNDSGRSYPDIEFKLTPITRASTGRFACETHDKNFQIIDTTPMDFDNPKLLNLLFFRAMLKEVWTLQRTRKGVMQLEQEKGQIPTPPSIHPEIRLKAILDTVNRLRPFIGNNSNSHGKNPAKHIVLRVKTSRPFVAASSAGGGLISVQELSMNDVRLLTGKEPNVSWSFTVIPQTDEHVVVASWLNGSPAKDNFSYLENLNGRELKAAISAELICFCENWFLHPKVWGSYGGAKQKAIVTAYDNLIETQMGKYNLWDNDKKWHTRMDVPNRHQINLFNYDESRFTP